MEDEKMIDKLVRIRKDPAYGAIDTICKQIHDACTNMIIKSRSFNSLDTDHRFEYHIHIGEKDTLNDDIQRYHSYCQPTFYIPSGVNFDIRSAYYPTEINLHRDLLDHIDFKSLIHWLQVEFGDKIVKYTIYIKECNNRSGMVRIECGKIKDLDLICVRDKLKKQGDYNFSIGIIINLNHLLSI